MRICVVQTRPAKGNIQANIQAHKKLIELAVFNKTDIIVFPELSITGYEPGLAAKLAGDINDSRLNDFQIISDNKNISIGVGMPLKADKGILISMIVFEPNKPRQVYYKQHLHEDEFPYFICGEKKEPLGKNKIAIAICYELSVPEHAKNAYKTGSKIYLVSIAKSVSGVEKAVRTLAETANRYSMTVLMSNCVGHCDNFDCGGKTSIWNNKGMLLGQLDDTNEGILIIDTITQVVIEKTIPNDLISENKPV